MWRYIILREVFGLRFWRLLTGRLVVVVMVSVVVAVVVGCGCVVVVVVMMVVVVVLVGGMMDVDRSLTG